LQAIEFDNLSLHLILRKRPYRSGEWNLFATNLIKESGVILQVPENRLANLHQIIPRVPAATKNRIEGKVDLIRLRQNWKVNRGKACRFPLTFLPFLFSSVAWLVTPVAAASQNLEKDFNELRLIEVNPPFKAPEFVLKDIRGNVFRLGTFPNNPLMLYFWASW
jgi:hypothetical protein